MSSSNMFARLISSATLTLILALAGCGGGGSSSGSSLSGGGGSGGGSSGGGGGGGTVASGTDCTHPISSNVDGCTYVRLSDDTGDFLVYRVKVTAISLTRRDGTVVSVVPASTTVDFARYTDLAEFLSLTAVPAGDYVSGTIGLDFTGASIEAQDSSGNAVTLNPVDTSGKPLGTASVTIAFDATHPLGLFPGEAHVLGINFDLDASNVIHSSSHTVTVQPFLVASIDSPAGTAEQVRGSADSVGGSNVTLTLQPFQGNPSNSDTIVVWVTGSTGFVVDQKVYAGLAGLSALKAAGKGVGVIAQGSFDFTSHHFIATEVLAGTGAPGVSDALEGVVTARNGNTLSVRSGEVYHSSGATSFSDSVSVDVGTGTAVHGADNLGLAHSIGDISVGEHILALGKFTSASSTTLDATSGFVLLRYTAVDGSVLSLVDNGDNSSVNLNLDEIQDRPIALFDFTGTGSDPTNYLIHLPCSCLNTGVTIGDPVTVTGYPSAFGTAPPDFNGVALTDFELADSVLSVDWAAPTANAFSSIEANSGIVTNLSSSPVVQTLREGGLVTNLNTLSGGAPAVVAKALGIFAISKAGTVQLYLNFTDFVTALHSDLAAGAKVSGFFAVGGYDAVDSLVSATTVSVILD